MPVSSAQCLVLGRVFAALTRAGAETFAGAWHPVTQEALRGPSVTRLKVPVVPSRLGDAGAAVAESVQALDGVGVSPASKTARRHPPGPAISRELACSPKP